VELTGRASRSGVLLAVVGVLGFSFKAVLVKLAYAAHPVDPVTLLALRMLYSAPMFAVLAWHAERAPGRTPLARRDVLVQLALLRPLAALDVPPTVHGLVLAMAVVSTFVPVWCVAEALKRVDANTVALVGCLGPVFTIAFGQALLGERIHALQLAGAAAVLSGVLLVIWRKPAAAPEG